MIKGLYSAFTAMEAAWRHQEVLSNNISNSNTVGYKREVATNESFADVLLSRQTPVPAPLAARVQAVVGGVGTGKFLTGFGTDFEAGNFQRTGQELDMALDAGFFAVQGEDGQRFFTRAGRFQRDAVGDLLTTAGLHVLGADGQPLNVGPGKVRIDADGTITGPDQEPLGRVMVVDFTPNELRRAGEAYFTANTDGVPINGGLNQGMLEQSNADMIEDLTGMLAVQRNYQANQAVLARLDENLELATSQLGTWR